MHYRSRIASLSSYPRALISICFASAIAWSGCYQSTVVIGGGVDSSIGPVVGTRPDVFVTRDGDVRPDVFVTRDADVRPDVFVTRDTGVNPGIDTGVDAGRLPDAFVEADGGSPVGERFSTPGEYSVVVPVGARGAAVVVVGAGGGGISAIPWGTESGLDGSRINASLILTPQTTLRVIVGEGGYGASCGGGTSGAGGGGLSGIFANATPLVVAGGGGSAGLDGFGRPGGPPINFGGGGGQRSDATATDGEAGNSMTFAGGVVGGRNCGGAQGNGGFGAGGGGGGTNNGFGSGGGGGGSPGGAGGSGGASGRSGNNLVADGTVSNGSAGGTNGRDGEDGSVTLTWVY